MIYGAISPTGGWIGTTIFVLLVAAAVVLFGIRAGKLVALLLKARPEDRTDRIDDRIGEFFLVVLGQSGVLRDPLPGIAHFFAFWGFIITGLGGLDLALAAFNVSLPFNHAFAILADSSALIVVIGLLIFAFRRAVLRPRQLSSFLHGPWDDYIILGLIFAVVVTLPPVGVFLYAASNGVAWSPLGSWIGPWFSNIGTDRNILLFRLFWWIHYIIFLGFLIYLPRSKHMHLLATPFNVFFRSYKPRGALPLLENLEGREDYGVSKVEQFTWKQLLDGYACTECGRCNTVCPATNTGKPLFPKEIILGVKEALFVRSNEILGADTLWSKIGIAGGCLSFLHHDV